MANGWDDAKKVINFNTYFKRVELTYFENYEHKNNNLMWAEVKGHHCYGFRSRTKKGDVDVGTEKQGTVTRGVGYKI